MGTEIILFIVIAVICIIIGAIFPEIGGNPVILCIFLVFVAVGGILLMWFGIPNMQAKRYASESTDSSSQVSDPAPVESASPLDVKLLQISNLKKNLANKKEEVIALKEDYLDGIENLKKEINQISHQEELATYEQAMADQRIRNDIILIQSKLSYVRKLHEIEAHLQTGYYEAEFMERRTQDDLKIAKVLTGEDAEKLNRQINEVIEKYQSDVGELAIDEKTLHLEPTENIWEWIKSK